MWQSIVYIALALGIHILYRCFPWYGLGIKLRLTQPARQLFTGTGGKTFAVRIPCTVRNCSRRMKNMTLAELVVDDRIYRLRECDIVKLEDKLTSPSKRVDGPESHVIRRGLTVPVPLQGASGYSLVLYFDLPESLRDRDIEATLYVTAGVFTEKKRLTIESYRTSAARAASFA